MTLYRAKGYGKLAWLHFLFYQLTFYKVTMSCDMCNYCDNISIIKATQQANPHQDFIGPPLKADYDLTNEISHAQMQLATIIPNLEDTQHVKGHQDSKKKFDDLSRPAQLNTLADCLATRQLDHLLQENATQDMLPLSSNPVYLYNNTVARLVTSKEPNAAKWAWSTQRMFKYWSKRLSLPMKDIQSIDWEGLKHTKKTLTENQKVFCYKLSADWLPTGHRMDLIGNLETECPSCSSPQETLCKSHNNLRADTCARQTKQTGLGPLV